MTEQAAIPISHFTVSDGTLVAEASDFGRPIGYEFDLVPATNGGVCHGVLVRDADDSVLIFRLAKVEKDPVENELKWWELVGPEGRKMTVFND